MPIARVPEPSCETSAITCVATGTPSSPLPSDAYSASGAQPARAAASIRSSPSATNSRSLSRHLRPASLRISLSCSLWGLVIVIASGKKKGAAPDGGAPVRWGSCRRRSGRRRLAGALGESAEGLGVARGDVRQHLAVELDAGQLEAVHERAVGHPVLARGGVDAGDPEAAEVALAIAAVAVRVGVRLHDGFLGALVGGVRLPAEALRAVERRAALLAGVDGALDAGHPS